MQIEIPGQCGLDVACLGVVVHRLTQLDHTTEFITAAILRVGQNELCVVLRGHGIRLRASLADDCEVKHKIPNRGGGDEEK